MPHQSQSSTGFPGESIGGTSRWTGRKGQRLPQVDEACGAPGLEERRYAISRSIVETLALRQDRPHPPKAAAP